MPIPLENIAGLFKTLSDPTRLRIIQSLTLDCQSVSAIIKATRLSQPLVSHHLRLLREYGLVRAEPHGGFTYYWLSDKVVWETVERASKIAGKAQKVMPLVAKRSKGTGGKTGRRKLATHA